MNKTLFSAVLLLALLPASLHAQRIQQKLGRGVVAVHRGSERSVTGGTEGDLISWRRLTQESDSTIYRVYINGSLATETRGTCYVPPSLTDGTAVRVVPVVDGKEDEATAGSFTYDSSHQPYSNSFVDIDFEGQVCSPDSYDAKYIWPADLDGDGEPDYVVAQVSRDQSVWSDKVQAYKADGTYLWTIDMGHNVWICGGQNDLVVAYDINCDGRAEVIVKSSDLTRFSDGRYVFGLSTPDTDGDGITDYTASTTRNPPFYVSVVDGLTGKELTSAELDYTQVHDGTDQYSRDNRQQYKSDNMYTEYASLTGHFAITYGDGIHPMLMMECLDRTTDGTHHNYVFGFSYDWSSGKPSNWHHSYTWSRNDKRPWPAEFHQLRVADVDGDGIDEMLEGGYGVNPVKDMVFSAGIGHGDRFRVGDLDPDRPGLEAYAIQQSALLGQLTYDAATGKHLHEWYLPSVFDVGRGECMDVDSTHRGCEVYSLVGTLCDIHGNVISNSPSYPYEGIWWDGLLDREVMNSPGGSGYGSNAMVTKYNGNRLCEMSQESDWAVHEGWGARAAFWGDIVGDWREEVLLLKNPGGRNMGFVGYTTNLPTPYYIYTLQEDPHYRLDCTTRGYYQSPNTGFYLGFGMPYPPLPPVMRTDLRWAGGGNWDDSSSSFQSFDLTGRQSFADGKSVLFDISGDTTRVISLNTTVRPSATYLMPPVGHGYHIAGEGSIGGTGEVWKSERGRMVIDANIGTTGRTVISDGELVVNGTISGPLSLRAKGTLGGNALVAGKVDFEGALNYEGCRLIPTDSIVFGQSVCFNRPVYIETHLGNGTASKVCVDGDAIVSDTLTFTIDAPSGQNEAVKGRYLLLHAAGSLHADPATLKARRLDGQPYSFEVDGHDIFLIVDSTRQAAQGVAWQGSEDGQWDYRTPNFTLDGHPTAFVQGDEVVFGDEPTQRTITVNEPVVQGGTTFRFDEGTYTLTGSGAIAGTGDLVKEGKGTLVMRLNSNTYTGRTIIRGGTLTVGNLMPGGDASSVGASAADASNLVIEGGTLRVDAQNTSTDRNIQIGDTATLDIATGTTSLNGRTLGSQGVLVKSGAGQLNLNYGGLYQARSLVMRRGVISQGAWNAGFGNVDARVEGNATWRMIANRSMSTIPSYGMRTTITADGSLTIEGAFRSQVEGAFLGTGSLAITSGGARCDVSSDFSQFDGDLTLSGSEARLMANVTDMGRLTLHLGDGTHLSHMRGGSATAVTASLTVGALADGGGTSADTQFGGSGETYTVGTNGKDASYSGKLTASTIIKKGKGTWTLTGTGSACDIRAEEGQLFINTSSDCTSGLVTVGDTLRLAGRTRQVRLRQGGVITSGVRMDGVGRAILSGDLTGGRGVLMVKARSSSGSDKFDVKGTLRLDGDTIRIVPLRADFISVGQAMTVFPGSKPAAGSTWVIDSPGYEFDDSRLATDGTLALKAVTGVRNPSAGMETRVDIYATDGRKVTSSATSDDLRRLPAGIYIVDGKKMVVE